MGAPIPISISISPEQIEESNHQKGFFFQENHWSPVYTDHASLVIKGSIADTETDFLLLGVNEDRYPVQAKDGRFEKRIHLRAGKNQIRISSDLHDVQPSDSLVVKVQPATISGIQTRFEGGVHETVPVTAFPFSNDQYDIQVSTPLLRIIGVLGTENVIDLKVKDSYNNTLPVEPLANGQFAVNYTLRERFSQLKFISTLENRTLHTTLLKLELQEIIQFDFTSPQNREGWLVQSPDLRFPTSQLDTVVIQGHLKAVKNGEVELVVGTRSQNVPVNNHQFEFELPLQINQMNRGRIKLSLNNQSFFKSFQLDQIEPVVKVENLNLHKIDGSFLMPSEDLPLASDNPLQLRESVLHLKGNAKFLGDLKLVLTRTPNDTSTKIQNSSGNFDIPIILEQGSYNYTLGLEAGGFFRPYYSLDVNVAPAIKIETVNHLPYREGKIKLSSPSLLLRGTVFAVVRGLMHLKIGQEHHSIPVLNGTFEMDNAIQLPANAACIELCIQAGDQTLERQYELEFPVPEPEPDSLSDDSKQFDPEPNEMSKDENDVPPNETHPNEPGDQPLQDNDGL